MKHPIIINSNGKIEKKKDKFTITIANIIVSAKEFKKRWNQYLIDCGEEK